MPTKAGRIRIEDLRVGRVIWDLAIDWTTHSTYPRPVKIVQLKRYGNDFVLVTREPDEGHLHTFFTNHRITRCGFYGVHDQSRLLKELVDGTVTPCNFFVNAKAVLRYRDRLLDDGVQPWQQPCRYEALGYMPGRVKAKKGMWRDPRGRSWPMTEEERASQNEIIAAIRDMAYRLYRASGYKATADAMRDAIASKSEPVKGYITDVEKTPYAKYESNFDKPTARQAALDEQWLNLATEVPESQRVAIEKAKAELAEIGVRIWSNLRVEQVDSTLTKFSDQELVKAIEQYIQNVLTDPKPVNEIRIENCEHHPDGSVTLSISGPSDVIDRIVEAKQQEMSLRALNVEPLPADPKDLAQGYSWPVRVAMEGLSQEDPGTLKLPASYGKADPDQLD